MAAFAQFGSDLDPSTQRLLARGARLTELLKQNQYQPMPIEEQVVSIFAGSGGYLDDLPVTDVKRFEVELLEFMRTRYGNLLDTIRDTGQLPEGDALADAVQTFKETFEPSEEVVVVTDEDGEG
jgi:F-type H+-transporting ATPase subunit alpha